MKRLASAAVATLVVLFATGCASNAPNYAPSITNVEALKKAGDFHAKLGEFSSIKGEGNSNPISVRGNPLVSPVADSYAAYVADAIRQELALANKLAPDARIELSGMLIKNDIDAGMGTGRANISMRMLVKKGGVVSFDRVISVEHQWESSFIGAVAIPRAGQEYPIMIQKLLAALYADKGFVAAVQ